MKTQFYISLSLKTIQGYVDYGQYFFGNDREAAYKLFRQLKGDPGYGGQLPAVYRPDGNPRWPAGKDGKYLLYTGGTWLNCKLIAREIFRLKNLEEIE